MAVAEFLRIMLPERLRIDAEDAGDVLAVTVPREGEGAVTVLQAPADGVGISGGGALVLESLSYGEDGAVEILAVVSWYG